MSRGLRTALWVLSSLAVLWTVLTIIGLVGMVGMHRGMMGGQGSDGTMSGMMAGAMMMGMMVHMALTWIVMLGLDGVFIYLIVTSGDRTEGQSSTRARHAA